ncbi:agmatine deiminase family protein [Alteromonas sediminis]|uniref:Agmatine deiminase family protein n=1 Tax=Alteromonas sediminis TaxID=2259342 RepID=A0A3N5XZ08_9ALTE|nr:agmatine deiminase family protein [Alteromonas sediminis]RPJ65236.1 agmatine deiminase family protein [Alteromonas sediminis]
MKQLMPEWAPCEAVILAWPDKHTDWAPWLADAQQTYLNLIDVINAAGAMVILLCKDASMTRVKDMLTASQRVLIVEASYNDTWVRDYAFLTCQSPDGPTPVEFSFNGWGQKFDASKDNMINKKVLASLCRKPLESSQVIAEGGALEIDDSGNLISTSLCLLNPKRNGAMSLSEYHDIFADMLGCSSFTAFENGHLDGDDTDGHIDTLVRFTPSQGIVIQACDNNPEDTHYQGLCDLVAECKTSFPEYQTFTLPLPNITNQDGDRLPASYANYLICNDSVLVPVYNQREDAEALRSIRNAYPGYRIVDVDCSTLINQFGSLHCITMQVPRGTLNDEVVAAVNNGVCIYAP